jgi:hypothetical protein
VATIDRTYPLEVEDIGRFVFRKRRIPDQVKIESEANRMTGGLIDDLDLQNVCIAYQTLKHLTVTSPEGWDLDDIDPLDPDDTAKMWKVWGALRDKERTFRKGAGA